MIAFSLQETAQLLGGELQGADRNYSLVDIDSRRIQPGQLFVALRGERFDGHAFVEDALRQGACAALVEEPASDTEGSLVCVDDTAQALAQLAAAWRQRSTARFIGITGSNGKTTLKEMVAAILEQRHQVLSTRGNYNNHIGVPLTLMRVQEHAYAVVEMGANHAGEIAHLTRLCRPHVAVLNNAGRAHLEGFGSLEGVAEAKGEIVQGLGPGGTFVLNADDRFASRWRALASAFQVVSFGVQQPAQISSDRDSYRVEWTEQGFLSVFEVRTPQDSFEVRLQLAGEHNRMNALAAIAATSVFGIPVQDMQQGLAQLQPVAGRLAPVRAANGARLIDDSYNANPDSVLAAVQVLQAAPGRRTLVLGDLGELGPQQLELHAELGRQAVAAGIDRLFSCGLMSARASGEFGGAARHFDSQQDLIDFLVQDLGEDDSVLIKGSRSSGMEGVIRALSAQEATC